MGESLAHWGIRTGFDPYPSNYINLRQPFNLRALSKSNQLLWQSFQYYSQHLSALEDIVKTGENLAEFLTNTIAQRLLFIQINVEDELNAYTVFETLNARGIALSSTDLLKNYLFSLFQGPDDLQEARRQWRRIINTISMDKFPEFLRDYLSLKQTKVRRERLFKVLRESVKTGEQAFELLDQLENYSSLFIALSNAQDEFWRDTPKNKAYIRQLELFSVKEADPTLLTAYEKFSSENFTRLLKLVCVISFRYTIVSSLNPNQLETLYNQVAISITNGEITHPKQVFDQLRSVYVPDEKFLHDFSLLSISTRGQKKKLVQYILSKLEADLSQIEVNEESFSIEHILPESPDHNWRDNFTDTQREEMVYRLGNLTLLEPHLNRQVGNQLYSNKQEVYQQSVYQLTQNILAQEWTPNTLATRQKELAKRAIHIWRSDFLESTEPTHIS